MLKLFNCSPRLKLSSLLKVKNDLCLKTSTSNAEPYKSRAKYGRASKHNVQTTQTIQKKIGLNQKKTYKLTDTAVLDLDVTEAVEALLVGILEETKGIEEAKRGLGTELYSEEEEQDEEGFIRENNC